MEKYRITFETHPGNEEWIAVYADSVEDAIAKFPYNGKITAVERSVRYDVIQILIRTIADNFFSCVRLEMNDYYKDAIRDAIERNVNGQSVNGCPSEQKTA